MAAANNDESSWAMSVVSLTLASSSSKSNSGVGSGGKPSEARAALYRLGNVFQ